MVADIDGRMVIVETIAFRIKRSEAVVDGFARNGDHVTIASLNIRDFTLWRYRPQEMIARLYAMADMAEEYRSFLS